MMRIGVFGGSFDPIHFAHLVLAEQCREQARLDRVLFVPAFRQPLKQNRHRAKYEHRVEMIQLAVAGHPAFQVSEIEKGRDPSYTVDTLRQLRDQHPADDLYLLVGTDCLPHLPEWHQPEEIARLASLLIATRPDAPADAAPPSYFRSRRVDMPMIAISSTDLRQRVKDGRSIRYMAPRAVECYIETHQLYKQ
jgi:nicotinate-nucleotide adenylyltransferase